MTLACRKIGIVSRPSTLNQVYRYQTGHFLMLVAALAASLVLARNAKAGSDNFDSYSNGQNIFTSGGNGQVNYFSPPPGGNFPAGSESLLVVADGSAPSSPNVLQQADGLTDDGLWAWQLRLDPSEAVDLSAAGSVAQFEFDFKTLSGPGGRVSLSVKPLYSVNATSSAEDPISNNHAATLSDAGLFGLNNAFVLSTGANKYQTNVWYHWDMMITRPGGTGSTFDYSLELTRISDGFSLDTINFSGAPDAGRDFLTGIGFFSSSNNDETILYDNLSIVVPPVDNTTTRVWALPGSGEWSDNANWSPQQSPNSNATPVIFGSVIATDETVFSNSSVNAKSIQFNNSSSYFIAGAGSVNLDSDTGSALIDVVQGDHYFTIDTNFIVDTSINVASGSKLSLNNNVDLGGRTLTKSGQGRLDINNPANMGTGTIVISQGSLGGVGTISGNLINSGGVVAPGNNPNRLSVTGNYTQQSAATFQVEIGGSVPLTEYDVLAISGSTTLDGAIDISLTNSFSPNPNDSFTVLTALGGISDLGLVLTGTGATDFSYSIVGGTNLVLTFQASDADFDSDGNVDGADFLVWQRGFGAIGTGSLVTGDANGDTNVDGGDLVIWESQFGTSGGPLASASSVPEPASATLILIFFGSFSVIGVRRSHRGLLLQPKLQRGTADLHR